MSSNLIRTFGAFRFDHVSDRPCSSTECVVATAVNTFARNVQTIAATIPPAPAVNPLEEMVSPMMLKKADSQAMCSTSICRRWSTNNVKARDFAGLTGRHAVILAPWPMAFAYALRQWSPLFNASHSLAASASALVASPHRAPPMTGNRLWHLNDIRLGAPGVLHTETWEMGAILPCAHTDHFCENKRNKPSILLELTKPGAAHVSRQRGERGARCGVVRTGR
jgi:hypothetical protein